METAIAAARNYRLSMKLSQAAFATRFGLPLSTFKQWERGVRVPDSASEVLLPVIVADPIASSGSSVRCVPANSRERQQLEIAYFSQAASTAAFAQPASPLLSLPVTA